MGGRGASAPFIPEPLRIAMPEPEPGSMHFLPPVPGTYQYIAITSRELPPGGPHYAFLDTSFGFIRLPELYVDCC